MKVNLINLSNRIFVIIFFTFLSLNIFAWDARDDELFEKFLAAKTNRDIQEVYEKNKERVTEKFLDYISDNSFDLAKKGGESIENGISHIKIVLLLSDFTKLEKSKALALLQLGKIYKYFKSDKSTALNHVQKSLELSQKIGDVLGEANCFLSLGEIAASKSDYSVAEKYYMDAIPLFRKMNNVKGEANCIFFLGQIAIYTDREHAEKLFIEAKNLYSEAGIILGEANCISSLGGVAFATNDLLKAEKYSKEAISLFRDEKDIQGEANSIFLLGQIAFRVNDYEKAEGYFREAIPQFQKIGDMQSEANCNFNLGVIALNTNDDKRAIKLLTDAFFVYQKLEDLFGEANCLRIFAYIAGLMKDYDKAEKAYKWSISSSYKARDTIGIAISSLGIGKIAFDSGDNIKAEKFSKSAYTIFKDMNDYYFQVNSAIFISKVYLRLQKISEAKEYLLNALEHSLHVRGKSGTASDRLRYQEGIGGMMKTTISDMGKVDKEFALYIWENFRGRTFLEGISTSMAIDISGIEQADKDKYTQLNEEKNKIFAELQALSASKTSEIQGAANGKYSGEEDKVVFQQKMEELEKQINSKRELLREVEKKVDEFEGKLAEKNERFRNLRRPNIPSVSELQKTLTEEEVALVYLDANVYKTEKENIGGPGVWVVEKEKLEFIPLSYSADPKKGNELIEWIGKYRDLVQLAAPNETQLKEKKALETKLSEILLSKPLSKISSGKKNLILIPDGVLGTLPFDILPYRNGILSESFTISYSPSLSILHLLRSKERDYSGLKRIPLLAFGGAHYTSGKGFQDKEDEKKESLAFLDVGQREARLNSYLRSGFREGKLTDLPGAREETKSIGKIYYEDEKQRDAALFFGAWASEPVLKSLNDKSTFTASRKKISDKETTLEDVRILHFSVHGEAMSDFPETSRIILSLPSQTPEEEKLKMEKDFPKYKNEDGSLLAAEIVGMRLKSDLVVMSACETGLGKVSSTEGIIGLTQSWMIAGSNGVVVSLWKVSDIGSRVFMTIFHEKIAKGISPKIAIKETRDIIRKNEWRKGEFAPDRTYKNGRNTFKDLDLSSPFFWSAFQYWGK
jgi:CHAT domain-containing protein